MVMEFLNNQQARRFSHLSIKIIARIRGYRKLSNYDEDAYIMKKSLLSCLVLVLVSSSLSACQPYYSNRQVAGTVGGAALGGLAGYGITRSAAGTAVGAVGGGLVGSALTQ